MKPPKLLTRRLRELALGLSLASAAALSFAQDNSRYITAPYGLSVEDEAALKRVIVQLNHALDLADYQLYASLFAEDAEFVSDFGVAKGREAITAALERSRPFISGKRHVAANFLFSGSAAEARVTTYLIVFEREAAVQYVGSAINTDSFEKRDGRWVLVRHDSRLDPSTEAAMQAAIVSPRE